MVVDGGAVVPPDSFRPQNPGKPLFSVAFVERVFCIPPSPDASERALVDHLCRCPGGRSERQPWPLSRDKESSLGPPGKRALRVTHTRRLAEPCREGMVMANIRIHNAPYRRDPLPRAHRPMVSTARPETASDDGIGGNIASALILGAVSEHRDRPLGCVLDQVEGGQGGMESML